MGTLLSGDPLFGCATAADKDAAGCAQRDSVFTRLKKGGGETRQRVFFVIVVVFLFMVFLVGGFFLKKKKEEGYSQLRGLLGRMDSPATKASRLSRASS